MKLEELGIADLATRIRARQTSSVEITTTLLDRVRTLDPTIRAWSNLDKDLTVKAAKQRDFELNKKSELGPLHGVPIGIKDLINTAEFPTRMGSPIFQHFRPTSNANLVIMLEKAGAIILGKTVTTQFGTFDPAETRNPWNKNHTPGGSSSGSAAAVAARMCPGTIGSQTVASIARPAAFCGVVGFMPTASRISRNGIFPIAQSLDHAGIFSRSIIDTSLLFNAIASSKLERPVSTDRVKLGIAKGYFQDKTSPHAWESHMSLIERLQSNGVPCVEIDLPNIFYRQGAILRTILRKEIAAIHDLLHSRYAEDYRPAIRALIETGSLTPTTDYLKALHARSLYQTQMLELFEDCDLIVSPGAPDAAPRSLSHTGDPSLSSPWTLADFPTISLPAMLNSQGMPLGIQVTGPPHSESSLLNAGLLIEQIVDFQSKPAQF